jgi:hypothetical protein
MLEGDFMRPQSIILFERIYLGCLVIATLLSVWFFAHPDHALPPGWPPALITWLPLITAITFLGGIAINLLLWFFIARRGASVAKWIYVVLFVLGLFGVVRSIMGLENFLVPTLMRIWFALHLLLDAICIWLLFRPDAQRWFKGERAPRDLHNIFS